MLALDAVLYRNGGTHGSPTWGAVSVLENVQVNPQYDSADANSRGSRVKKSANTLLGLEVTARLKKKPGDANYEAFMDALISTDPLDLLVLDGPKDQEGVRGWRGDFQVSVGNEDQGLGNVLYVDITLKPADTDNEMQAVKVSALGALTYATVGDGTFT